MEIIKLEGITKVYRTTEVETTALENVNLTVRKGEFLSIMGPSGCGKSTLLNLMGLLDLPDQGKIIAGKVNVLRLDPPFSGQVLNTGFDTLFRQAVSPLYVDICAV